MLPRMPRTLSDVARPGEPVLKQHQLADPRTTVTNAKLPQLQMTSCMPIQLAAQLGAKSVFIFLLHKQTDTLWKWGPGESPYP